MVRSCRILVMTFGSRGDVQPLLALSSRLTMEGHAVLCSSNVNHKDFIEGFGLRCVPAHFDFSCWMSTLDISSHLRAQLREAHASSQGDRQ